MIAKRYLTIKCRICKSVHCVDRACHVCGAESIEDANGVIHIGRIKPNGQWIEMGRAGSVRDSIMRAASKIGFRLTYHLN